ncbi:MAG: hypothetical protein M3Q06_03410 [Bacteroidota bacterium]|nr:hypothetical protein [Bacteroidota bacterium]
MKNNLSSFIALITLLSITTAFNIRPAKFANPHFVGTVCYNASTGTISGKVAGLGKNADGYTITISGDYSCTNPAGNKPPAWQHKEITGIPLQQADKPGQYTFSTSADLQASCPNPKWTVSSLILNASLVNADGITVATEAVSICQ